MKKVYIDKTITTGCTGFYIKDTEVIPAGTTVYSMSVKDKNEEYLKYEKNYDICFIFDDDIPEIDFYAVPMIDIFAKDHNGGFFGTAGEMTDLESEAPICYIDSDRNCFIAADNGRDFIKNAAYWKQNLVPDRKNEFFASREEAEKKYEFICSYSAVLNKISEKYQEILKEKLTGIYVHGSIAFGCFNWEKSDIDFIVVIKEALSLEEKERLIQILLGLDEEAPSKGFEMSIVIEKYCDPFVYPTPFELHFSNAHREKYRQNLREYCEKMHGTDKDLAAHFTVIRKVGWVLCGADITSVFGQVPEKDYFDSIRGDVEDAENEIMENPVYIILNLCRVLAFVKEGIVISKKQGGEWGIRNLPEEYRPLVKKALLSYGTFGEIRAKKEQLRQFAGYMLERLIDSYI